MVEDDDLVPRVKLDIPPSRMPPGWNNANAEWVLPDWAYSRERYEEQWARYKMIEQFEKENNFQEQSYMFISDYREWFEKRKAKREGKEEEKKEEKDELIKLTRPVDFDDLNYIMDNYDYDPKDDVVNSYNDTEAENFIRSLVVKYRKSIGKQI